MLRLLSIALFLCASVALADHDLHTFKKLKLSDQFYSEGATFGDFNHDGKLDAASGPYWYEGPTFEKKHEIYKPKPFDPANYSDNFLSFSYDFNADGWPDILVYDFPGKQARWYENPKGPNDNKDEHWKSHTVFDIVDNESPTFGDLLGTGKPVMIFTTGGRIGYASPDYSEPTKPWKFHPISPKGSWQRFTHGLGWGDINGDGKNDILEPNGWWQQPDSLEGDPIWTHHPFKFCDGAQMHVYDVNGDGKPDVITSLSAHGYGLAWYEQIRNDKNEIDFKKHLIMGALPADNKYGVKFSQLHALDLIDIDGDGLKDIVTGKRYWAHGPKGDAEPGAPAVLYWFKLVRQPHGEVDFIPYMIDDDSGVGIQVATHEFDNTKSPAIAVGNKKGTFVFLPEVKKVSDEDWEKSQPKATGRPPRPTTGELLVPSIQKQESPR